LKTNIYVDGFNLYYGALKGTPHKWLDLSRWAPISLAPKHEVHRIKYFTALVKPKPGRPESPIRQQTYLRALNTIENLSIIKGHFLSSECSMPLARPVPGGPLTVRVIKTEEKGSDVNLACEAALVVSNDSDLLEPIRVARSLGLIVGLACPHRRVSNALKSDVHFVRMVRSGALARSQFPESMSDGVGTFTKPVGW
jgi:hypothetical protein